MASFSAAQLRNFASSAFAFYAILPNSPSAYLCNFFVKPIDIVSILIYNILKTRGYTPRQQEEMKMKKYEVYESNAGNLTLIAYNKDGHADYIHTGYEFVPGQLKQDLQALDDGDDPASDWDGNEIKDYTAEQIAEAKNGGWGELVADNDGIYLDHAGYAATTELGEEDE